GTFSVVVRDTALRDARVQSIHFKFLPAERSAEEPSIVFEWVHLDDVRTLKPCLLEHHLTTAFSASKNSEFRDRQNKTAIPLSDLSHLLRNLIFDIPWKNQNEIRFRFEDSFRCIDGQASTWKKT